MRDLSSALTNNSHKKNHRISALQLNVFLLLSIIAIGILYLFTVNSMATAGFKIKELSLQINKLEEEHKTLELKNSSLQSVSTIQEETRQLNFVPTTNVTYLKDDSFALK